MDFKVQTAVLAAMFVLVGIMFLVPTLNEKALAYVDAQARANCGDHPCEFTYINSVLVPPTRFEKKPESGTGIVQWRTTAGGGDEKGTVFYNVEGQKGIVEFYFYNPTFGSNECRMKIGDILYSPGTHCTETAVSFARSSIDYIMPPGTPEK